MLFKIVDLVSLHDGVFNPVVKLRQVSVQHSSRVKGETKTQ